MSPTKKIKVEDIEITIFEKPNEDDYFCLTDMSQYKHDGATVRTDAVIMSWLRNKDTLEFLGLWESINNPNFNPTEFDGIRNQAGTNRFTITAKQWRDANPVLAAKNMNPRDVASISELVVIGNLESMNATLIKQGLGRKKRYEILSEVAKSQLESLNNTNLENRFRALAGNDPKLIG